MHSNVSSPVLKASKKQDRLTKRRILMYLVTLPCLLLLVILICFRERLRNSQLSTLTAAQGPTNPSQGPFNLPSWPTNPPHAGTINMHRPHTSIVHSSKTSDLLELQMSEPIQARSLTALLPVTLQSISNFEAIISSLLRSPGQLHEVIVSCPEVVLPDVRRIVRKEISAQGTQDHLEISLRPWGHKRDSNMAIMHVASEVSTDWIVFLDDSGLINVDSGTQDIVLNPMSIPLPTGPKGFASLSTNTICIKPSVNPQPVSFVIPPFVMPYSLVSDIVSDSSAASTGFKIWADLGERISRERLDGIGGVVIGTDATSSWCHFVQSNVTSWNHAHRVSNLQTGPDRTEPGNVDISNYQTVSAGNERIGTFAMLFPSLRDMRLFSSVACRLQANGYIINVLLYGDEGYFGESSNEPMDWRERTILFTRCRLNYDTPSPDDILPAGHPNFGISFVSDWLDTFDEWPDIVVALKDQDSLSGLATVLEQSRSVRPSLILIPYSDLAYCEWMGSLSVQEWKSWNVPRVDISVITKDRPRSLARLLSSLSSAKFFGDSLIFRINLEQTSDTETMQLVERFRWNHGITLVHHRVIHGGLLPAVVESWYPHSNDSYGLLLEDDVELSPMFYAWVKMTILRYRYGVTANKSPQLFGISLYQQKNIELNLQGRRPFDARALFYDHSLPHPDTPYLSQIPCSWGAVYFPEHWREFHEYLAIRFSEYSFSIDEEIVPGVRSNRWTKSWKKYFIELVYLRGYAMLYPNYADFVSFSTNHLEVGSHVKDRPNDVYLQRKELFLLPLMALSNVTTNSSTLSARILDLPEETLPPWHLLPVLNLTGSLTSLETLIDQGQTRRTQLTGCSGHSSVEYDVRDLMCV